MHPTQESVCTFLPPHPLPNLHQQKIKQSETQAKAGFSLQMSKADSFTEPAFGFLDCFCTIATLIWQH